MGQMVVRKINDEALERFKARARSEGVSAEALLRRMIETEPARMTREQALKRADELRAMTPRSDICSVELLHALRDGDDAGH
jgi:plasmid stability protein